MSLSLGIDMGTSACRVAIMDDTRQLHYLSRAEIAPPIEHGLQCEQSPDDWWQVCLDALNEALEQVDRNQITRIAVDGTSSTLLLCDANGRPQGNALMYRDQRAQQQADRLSELAPTDSAVHSPSSSLAKLLWLKDDQLLKPGLKALHQADWISGQLRGEFGTCDENNALKLGYDACKRRWPAWLAECDLPVDCLPEVVPAGTPLGRISPQMAQQLGLSDACQIIAGTTDSTASFIASGARDCGDAVTVLGSTLVVKVLSDKAIFNADVGVYSHRLGDKWLVGGASNTGGAVLQTFFSLDEIKRLSKDIDPNTSTGLHYTPLCRTGERFPTNNPNLVPNFEPRPENDVIFLQAIFESIANIEQQAYQTLTALGAPRPTSIRTCGGGAKNPAWLSIRQHLLNNILLEPDYEEAAVGAAILASTATVKT